MNYTAVLNFLYSLLIHASFSSYAGQIKNEIVGVTKRLNMEINTNKVKVHQDQKVLKSKYSFEEKVSITCNLKAKHLMRIFSKILITFLYSLHLLYLTCKELRIPNKA